MELWSSWDRGEPGRCCARHERCAAAGGRLQAGSCRWTGWPWKRSCRADRGWLLTLAGLELARDEVLLALPRLQLDLRGETVELRVQDVALEPSASCWPVLVHCPLGRRTDRAAASPWHPSRLQVNVSDISAPMAGWQLAANFTSVAVDAWHGAPALSGASGYTQLAPGGGSVVLDSKQFSMHFPTVYEQPWLMTTSTVPSTSPGTSRASHSPADWCRRTATKGRCGCCLAWQSPGRQRGWPGNGFAGGPAGHAGLPA